LPSTDGREISLADFAGRTVLPVFTQSGCSPCKAIVPVLNRLAERGTHQVLVVNNAEINKTRVWARDAVALFPVLAQEKYAISKQLEAYATPFAFLIDERGIIGFRGSPAASNISTSSSLAPARKRSGTRVNPQPSRAMGN
jgi:thiol-disulfide isomerase/thioredoxin